MCHPRCFLIQSHFGDLQTAIHLKRRRRRLWEDLKGGLAHLKIKRAYEFATLFDTGIPHCHLMEKGLNRAKCGVLMTKGKLQLLMD